jgi:hypothetical protein
MTQVTDQDIRELKSAIDTNSKAVTDLAASVGGLREEMRVGFAQVDTKFAQLEGKMDTRFAKIEGDIALLRQPRDFAEFVKRTLVSGIAVTVFGGLLLAAAKLLIFGNV